MTDIDILTKFARYNQDVNNQIIQIFEQFGSTKFSEKAHSYFDSIEGICIHLIATDLVWFKRMLEHNLFKSWLEKEISPYGTPSSTSKPFSTWSGFIELRTHLDSIWTKVIAEFPAGKLHEEITYMTLAKKNIRITWSGALLHLFNHMTHHRGAISQILDSWNIDNDYSGINKYFGEIV